jgi:AraC-like DNA-binding protein
VQRASHPIQEIAPSRRPVVGRRMTDPASVDYEPWFFETGAEPAFTWVFEGADGLERLADGAVYSAADPATFRARLIRVQLDHVALEVLVATPHRYERTREHAADARRTMLSFVLVAEGRLRFETRDATFTVEAGECVLVDSQLAVAYTAETDVRMLRTMVGSQHVPVGLRHHTIELTGPLERTPLVDAFIAFISNVLRAAAGGRPVAGIHTTRAVSDLHTALLAEAQDSMLRSPKDDGLRDRIEQYIDAHLAEPDLGPRSIAQALGVSVRHVHGTFNDDGHTVARAIRASRVEGVSAELRTTQTMPSIAYLVGRFGFRNANALQRAFRHRYGESPAAYHRGGHTRM